MAKIKLPQRMLDVLGGFNKTALVAEFDGPGPFQMPMMTDVVALNAANTTTIIFATESGQEVRMPITSDALRTLTNLLQSHKRL